MQHPTTGTSIPSLAAPQAMPAVVPPAAASWIFLLRRFGLSAVTAFFGALLFGLHPLRVEPVAWVSGRKDLLCALFFFSGMWFYQAYLASSSRKHYFGALIAYLLALASKPVAISFPFVLLLQDLVYRKRLTKSHVIEKVPFFLFAAVMARQNAAATRVERLRSELRLADPSHIMARGFAAVSLVPSLTPVRSIGDVSDGSEVRVTVADGSFDCEVQSVAGKPGRTS